MGRVLGPGKIVSRGDSGTWRFTSRVYIAVAAAECNRPSAHGAHAQPDADGHHRPLASHARICVALAARYRPRRHSHTDDGGAPASKRRKEPTRDGAGEIHRA